MPWSGFASALRCRRGAAASEFALVGTLLLTLLLGTMELSRYLFTLEALRSAAAEAARAVTIRGSANMNAGRTPCAGLSGALTGVRTEASFLNPGSLTMTMSGCATTGAVTTVQVAVAHPFAFAVRIPGLAVPALEETALAVFN
jgi:Flp pilus assembly protein TadG